MAAEEIPGEITDLIEKITDLEDLKENLEDQYQSRLSENEELKKVTARAAELQSLVLRRRENLKRAEAELRDYDDEISNLTVVSLDIVSQRVVKKEDILASLERDILDLMAMVVDLMKSVKVLARKGESSEIKIEDIKEKIRLLRRRLKEKEQDLDYLDGGKMVEVEKRLWIGDWRVIGLIAVGSVAVGGVCHLLAARRR